MAKWKWAVIYTAVAVAMPGWAQAQDIADSIKGLHGVLDELYNEMMPMCSDLIGIGSGIAGFAALWYIAARVWRHLANAEPIDFYPLFRPFVIGFCILNFTLVLDCINAIMKPTVTGTAALVENSNRSIELLLKQKEEKLKTSPIYEMYVGPDGNGNKDKWYEYTYDEDPSEEDWIDGIGNDIRFSMEKIGYSFKNSIKEWMSEILRVLFEAAALCINTLRTFQLVVLAILGPLVFGLAVFDGFQHTLTVWLARYINIFLWLPVANIFGGIIAKIQEKMIELDLGQIEEAGNTFFSSTDIGYLIFMIIGIVGYTTVPSIANYIVHAAGGGALQTKVSSMFSSKSSAAAGMAGAAAIGVGGAVVQGGSMVADAMGNAAGNMSRSMASQGSDSEYFKDRLKGND
ncbi:MAG TPA: conjugative transposon protein TraJ [Pseudosphingobacterium sp.]|nr:conjugative transposon protein TraJ [Pseudosphingobacterium sp.]